MPEVKRRRPGSFIRIKLPGDSIPAPGIETPVEVKTTDIGKGTVRIGRSFRVSRIDTGRTRQQPELSGFSGHESGIPGSVSHPGKKPLFVE